MRDRTGGCSCAPIKCPLSHGQNMIHAGQTLICAASINRAAIAPDHGTSKAPIGPTRLQIEFPQRSLWPDNNCNLRAPNSFLVRSHLYRLLTPICQHVGGCARPPPHLQRTVLEDDLGPQPRHSETLAAMAPTRSDDWIRDSLGRLPEEMQADSAVSDRLTPHLGLLILAADRCGSFAQYQQFDLLIAEGRAAAIRNAMLMPMTITGAPFPEKWRHWKRREDSASDPMNRRQLEQRLADKQAERLLRHFHPVAEQIPRLI